MRKLALALFLCVCAAQAVPIKVLIIDGQNNHDWRRNTPVLKKLLEETGLFSVDVATAPPEGAGKSGFLPRFSDYATVVSNYNGEPWSPATQAALEQYVRNGGGFVSYHAADNAFPQWKEYNEMIGLSGWGNRNESTGPYLRFRDGKAVHETKPGPGGHHGQRHAFQVTMRDPSHPIAKGLPTVWMHATDELYDSLRGAAEHLDLIATAYSDPAKDGSGENEPILFTIAYGKGRVFQTTLGHDMEALRCVGFIATFQRGVEWTATGKVTQKVPADFPTADKIIQRPEPK